LRAAIRDADDAMQQANAGYATSATCNSEVQQRRGGPARSPNAGAGHFSLLMFE